MRISKNGIQFVVMAASAACILLWQSAPALAAFAIEFKEGSTTYEVGPNSDFTTFTVNQAIPGTDFSVDLTVSASQSAAVATLSLSGTITDTATTVTGKKPTSQKLTILYSEQDYTLPGTKGTIVDLTYAASDNFSNAPAGSDTSEGYLGNGNELFGDPGKDQEAGPIIDTSANSGMGAASVDVTRTKDPYQLTGKLDLTLQSGGNETDTINDSLTVNPTPSGSVMLLSALPLFGLFGLWRLRNRRPSQAQA